MSTRRKQQQRKRKANEFGVTHWCVVDLWVCVVCLSLCGSTPARLSRWLEERLYVEFRCVLPRGSIEHSHPWTTLLLAFSSLKNASQGSRELNWKLANEQKKRGKNAEPCVCWGGVNQIKGGSQKAKESGVSGDQIPVITVWLHYQLPSKATPLSPFHVPILSLCLAVLIILLSPQHISL